MSHDAISTFKFTHKKSTVGGDRHVKFITGLVRTRMNKSLFGIVGVYNGN